MVASEDQASLSKSKRKRTRRNSSEYILDQLLTPYVANNHFEKGQHSLPAIGLRFITKRARYMCIDDDTFFKLVQRSKAEIVFDILRRKAYNVQLLHNVEFWKEEFTSTEMLVAYNLINM